MNIEVKPIHRGKKQDESPNIITVVTRNLDDMSDIQSKHIDFSNREDRKWLTRHQHWALTHRHSVFTYQV